MEEVNEETLWGVCGDAQIPSYRPGWEGSGPGSMQFSAPDRETAPPANKSLAGRMELTSGSQEPCFGSSEGGKKAKTELGLLPPRLPLFSLKNLKLRERL